MKRVAIWAAVSSLPQAKKISLEDQITTGRDHARQHGAQVVSELVVPGESRNIVLFEDACQRIDAYARLKALIDAKSVDALVYLDPSRLGRTAARCIAPQWASGEPRTSATSWRRLRIGQRVDGIASLTCKNMPRRFGHV